MRIPLATPLKTRVGDTSKDARLKNAYAEVRGDQSVVRHRPSARGGVEVGTGVAQGGYGLVIFWGDTPYVISESTGTDWDAGTIYPQGSMVSYGFANYWSVDDEPLTPNENNNPVDTPERWSTTPTYCVSPVIPAPVILGTSEEYTENATPPDDVTLSDESIGHYCIGELRKKVVVSYTISAGATTAKVSGAGFDSGNNHIGYGATVAEAAAAWFAELIYTTCPGHPVSGNWISQITSISDFVYGASYNVGAGCPGNFTGNIAVGTISSVTAYILTATTTESYYTL